MKAHEEMHAALEQTGQDAQRFRWVTRNFAVAIDLLSDAITEAESKADVLALAREKIDVLRRAEATRSAEGQGAPT